MVEAVVILAALVGILAAWLVFTERDNRSLRRMVAAGAELTARADQRAAERVTMDSLPLGPEGAPATVTGDEQPDGRFLLTINGTSGSASIYLSKEGRANLLRHLSGGVLRPELAILREEVAVFALAMERRLRAHDDERGWPPVFKFGLSGLERQLRQNLDALTVRVAVVTGDDPERRCQDKAADVANLAMLLSIWHARDYVQAARQLAHGLTAKEPERVQ